MEGLFFFLLFASLGLVLTLFLSNSFMVWSCLHLVLLVLQSRVRSSNDFWVSCSILRGYRRSCIEGDSTKLILFLVVRVYFPSAHLGFIKSWLLEVSQRPFFSTSFLESRCPIQGEPDSDPSFLFFFFLIHLFYLFFIFGCVGSSLRCTGFSLQWLLLLQSMVRRLQ